MAYQLKYYLNFKDIDDNQYTVNIYEDTTDIISSIEIRGIASPFIVNLPLFKKTDSIRGSGANINILSETNGQFVSLYTSDIQKFRVEFKKGTVVKWTGYLDSEVYSEQFNQLDNYPVNIKANDGFNILDRLNYVQADNSKYSGIQTQWQVITNILSKLKLNYNAIYVSISTLIDGINLQTSETIFHKTFVNVANYINEDGDAETCRSVLEATLKPYGAFCQQINGSLYITDLNCVFSDTPVNFKKYDNSFAYISTESISMNIGDLSAIGFASSDISSDTENGINQQVVSYSPYKQTMLFEGAVKDSNLNGTTTFQNFGDDSSEYSWKETYYPNCIDFEMIDANKAKYVLKEGTGTKNSGKEYYLKLIKTGTVFANSLKFNKINNYLLSSQTNFLKISCQGFARTKTYLGKPDENTTAVYSFQVPVLLKLGDFTRGNYVWNKNVSTLSNTLVLWLDFKQDRQQGTVNDVWVTNREFAQVGDTPGWSYPEGQLIKLWQIQNIPGDIDKNPFGIMEIYLLSDYRAFNFDKTSDLTSIVKDVRLKDFTISIVDQFGNEISNKDIEYKGFLNPQFKNEGEKLSLIHGTNFNDNSTELGGLMYQTPDGYSFIKSWTRNGISDRIERLLLRTIMSNYKNQTMILRCSINMVDSLLGYLTYATYLSGKKMMITSADIDYSEAEMNLTIQEFTNDYLDIAQ